MKYSKTQLATWVVMVVTLLMFGAEVHRLLHTRAEIVLTTIQDDSFYYILPAWNAFHHGLISFDLLNKTYGFQPGYFICLYLLAPLAQNAHGLTVISLIFNFSCYALTGFFAYRAFLNIMPEKRGFAVTTGGIAATLIFFANGLNYLSSQTGKENALAALLLVLSICVSQRLRNSAALGQRARSFALFGALLGALALTRIHPSTAISMCLLAIYAVNGKVFSRNSIITALGFLVAFVPWFIFSRYYFGSVLPTSGALKSGSFDLTAQGLHSYWLYLQVYWTRIAKFMFGYPDSFFLLQTDIARFTSGSGTTARLIAWASVAFAAIAVVYAAFPNRDIDKRFKSFVRLCTALTCGSFLGHALLLWNYAHWAYSTDYFTWYIYDVPLFVALLAGCGLAAVTARLMSFAPGRAWVVLPVALLAGCGWTIARNSHSQKIYPYGGFQAVAYGIMQEIKDGRYPECSAGLVGAYSSGLMGLELDGRVVNLDGLANDNAARVRMRGGSIPEFLSKQKITCFVDIYELLPIHPDYDTVILGQYAFGSNKIVVASLRHHRN